MSRIQIVIPSMGRAETITTHTIVSGAIICVPQLEVDQYELNCPGVEVIGHPDSVIGLPAKRQWILERFDTVFMMDDDCLLWAHLGHAKGEKMRYMEPDHVAALIQTTYEACLDIGCCFFGFNRASDSFIYDGLRPFRFSGFIPGKAIGIIEAKKNEMRYDLRYKNAEDYYMSLLNAYKHRFCFRDMRYGMRWAKSGKLDGGNSVFKNSETEKADTTLLMQQFGSSVILKPDKRSRKQLQDPSDRESSHPYERGIKLPF
jgi:hypothetical protein